MAGRARVKRPRYGDGRLALLNAVARVVSRAGLRGLTYRSVAAEAGVSHGSVTLHFGSRDAMIEQAHEHVIRSGILRSSLEPGTGSVVDFVAGLSDSVAERPENEAFQYELLLESRRRRELQAGVRRVSSAYTEAAARELERMGLGGDLPLARFVADALDGVVLQQTVGLRSREETEEDIDRLREMLASLIAARKVQ